MSSPTDDWISSDAGLLHYNGVAWTRVLTPADHPNQHLITSLGALSAHDLWALGDIALHYNGAVWVDTHTPLPSPFVHGVVMRFAQYGWAVGNGGGQGNADQGVILRYTGGSWQQLDQTFDTDLSAVSMDSPSDAWAVGYGVILHYTHGTWTEVPGPLDVHGA
jgi:hypothetical protein